MLSNVASTSYSPAAIGIMKSRPTLTCTVDLIMCYCSLFRWAPATLGKVGIPTSVQDARWSTSDEEVDRTLIKAGSYACRYQMRDADARSRSVSIYIAMEIPECQNIYVEIMRQA
jgi:hypothetical protein